MNRILTLILAALLLAGCKPAGPLPATAPIVSPPAATGAAVRPLPPTTSTSTHPATSLPAGSPLFPGLDLVLKAPLVDAPAEADVLVLALPEPLTAETAQAAAARLGMDGVVYRRSGTPPGAAEFLVTAGAQRLHFYGTPERFDYSAGHPALLDEPPTAVTPAPDSGYLPWLEAAGLLDFGPRGEVEIVASPAQPGDVALIQHFDGHPIEFPPGNGPSVRGRSDADGQPLWVRYQPLALRSTGSYPLLTAAQAWEGLLSGHTNLGVIFHEYLAGLEPPRTWLRRYPEGEDLTIFGHAAVYAPAAGGEPLILLNGYPVTGNTRGLAEAVGGGRLVQAWGQVETDKYGQPLLALAGWQAPVIPEQILEGVIEYQGAAAVAKLLAGDTRYTLPNLPLDVPIGETVTVRGVVVDHPELTLEWDQISAGPRELVRAGGPGFLPLDPERPTPQAAATHLPERLEGLTGAPQVIVHAYSDGSSQVEVQLALVDGGRVRLDGPGLQGIEAYHHLPVRLWGEAAEAAGGLPVVSVERYEPLYPAAKLQAWLGLLETVTLDGIEVWRLTTPAGEQFVIASSRNDRNPARLPVSLSDPLIVEGFLTGETLAGFPLLQDIGWASGIGRNDLAGYAPASAQPRVLHEPGTAGARRPAVIETVQLIYYGPDAAGVVQPAWRFAGQLADGQAFMLLVQAVAPQ